MKLSVCMITYNQEKFIAQAIESVLMQQVSFDWELLIGEDCSTDATSDIARQYAAEHPDHIKLLARESNLGFMRNFVSTLQSCSGEYVALLEGDDYWTASDKLQSQVDLLDEHPETAVCFHPVRMVYEDSDRSPEITPAGSKDVSTIEDLLLYGNFIPTCSVVFRNRDLSEIPEWFCDLPFGDWPLHILNTRRGDIRYLDGVMADYRVHGGGVWSLSGAARRYRALMKTYSILRRNLEPEYRPMLDEGLYRLALDCENHGFGREARACALRRLSASPFSRRFEWPLLHILRLCAPSLHRAATAPARLRREGRAENRTPVK